MITIRRLSFALFVLLLASPAAPGQVEIYLEVPDLASGSGQGKAEIPKHWIPISTFGYEVTNETRIGSASSGAGAGKAQVLPIVLVKELDAWSPSFARQLFSGGHWGSARVHFIVPPEGKAAQVQEIATLDLGMVFVKRIKITANTLIGDVPAEEIELVCGTIRWTILGKDEKGAPKTTSEFEWDAVKNEGK